MGKAKNVTDADFDVSDSGKVCWKVTLKVVQDATTLVWSDRSDWAVAMAENSFSDGHSHAFEWGPMSLLDTPTVEADETVEQKISRLTQALSNRNHMIATAKSPNERDALESERVTLVAELAAMF